MSQPSVAASPDSVRIPTIARAGAELFLISLLILFLELACIRWFPAHVLFLTFFTNVVLLASFLGMSLGCLAAGSSRNYLSSTAPLLALTMLAAGAVEILRDRLESILDVGHQTSPQLVFFGTETHFKDVAHFFIPMEVVEGIFFLLIALVFVGPGQELGRAMKRLPNHVRAYTVNIFGSIVGIVLFFLCSWLRLSPVWWFSLVVLGLGFFLFRGSFPSPRWWQALFLGAIVILAYAPMLIWTMETNEEYWSPYYRINYFPINQGILTNLIGHQTMVSCWDSSCAYALPYFLNRDSGGKPFEDVLIIGAGSGNDVSRSLQWGTPHIDAVEIDPVIWTLGKWYHPDQPYDETSRVKVHLTDGRNFLRSTDKKYDLIVYALVDSLVLHSSYSNLRLESYLFTKQAMADVKRCLKPHGLFVMYNFFRQGWIVARLQKTLQEVFGTESIVMTMPYEEVVEPEQRFEGFTFLIAGDEEALAPIRKVFQRPGSSGKTEPIQYWVDVTQTTDPKMANGFSLTPRGNPTDWQPFGPARVVQPEDLDVATDDWPFLYLRQPLIPYLSLRGAAVMGVLSLMLLGWFVPPRQGLQNVGWRNETKSVLIFWTSRLGALKTRGLFDGRMFFLGAGFMLIETKAVVHLALLFGSTWVVNSVVFLAVLLMILIANLFVLAVRPRLLWPYYGGLFIALVVNAVVPLNSFLGLSASMQILGSCLLVFAPILFAAVIFAVSFGRAVEADRAFGFNIAGAVLGGLAEYSSMLLGFRYLLLVALFFYILSAIFRTATKPEALPAGD